MSNLSYKWLWQNPMGIVVTGATLITLVYSLWVVTNTYTPLADQIASSLILIIFNLFGFYFGLQLYAKKSSEVRFRRGWLAISLALLCSALAEIIWMYYETILGISPYPSIADFFYLIFYPLILAGILLFPIISVQREERFTLLVDLSIVLVASVMAFWFFLLAPMAVGSGIDLERVIAVSYPVGDFLLLIGVIALLQKDLEIVAKQTLIFLAVGLLFTGVADVLFAYFENNSLPYQSPYLNILWIASSLFLIMAPVWQIHHGQQAHTPSPLFINRYQIIMRQSLPYMVAAIGPLLILLTIKSTDAESKRLFGLLIGNIALIILILVRQYVVLIENVHLYEELQHLAITDGLTKIFNRHFFNLVFQREIERGRRYNKPLCLLMMDIDHFKFFNDQYGHLHGDMVLKVVAQTLSRNLRKTDILARFGGDEFAAILTETDMDGALSVASKLQEAVTALTFMGHSLSISIGLTNYRAGMSAEQFIEKADKELYQCKDTSPSSLVN